MTILAAALLMGTPVHKPTSVVFQVSAGPVIQGLRPIALAAAPTGSKFLACLEDGSVRVMDAKSRQTVRILAKHPQGAYAAAWSPDGTYVAPGDESARTWIESPITGSKIREYRTHTKGIEKLSFSMTRQYLASTGKDDQINIYDLSKPAPKEVRKILGKGANFYGAAFSPKLPYTISTGILGHGGRVYDCNSGQCLGFLNTVDDQGVFDVCYNPAGTQEVTGGKNGEVLIWDSASKKTVATLKGHQDWVNNLAYSPNGKFIASASVDKSVKIWNSTTGEKVGEITGQSSVGSPVCFTADGNSLITVNDAGDIQFNAISPSQASRDEPAKPVKATKKKTKKHHRRK